MEKRKMLIAEDDGNILELLRLYMTKEGFEVETASNGGEALVKFRIVKPDIVLLDIMMPGLDGWEVCHSIRKESNVPVIMLTARGETADKVTGLELGADDYIVKPFEMPEVVARVACLARKEGLRVSEVAIGYRPRSFKEGKKIGWRDGVRALWCIFKYNLIG